MLVHDAARSLRMEAYRPKIVRGIKNGSIDLHGIRYAQMKLSDHGTPWRRGRLGVRDERKRRGSVDWTGPRLLLGCGLLWLRFRFLVGGFKPSLKQGFLFGRGLIARDYFRLVVRRLSENEAYGF